MGPEVTNIGKYMAQDKWAKENTTQVNVKLFHGKDSDILEWLSSQPSKQAAIKNAVRDYLSRSHTER